MAQLDVVDSLGKVPITLTAQDNVKEVHDLVLQNRLVTIKEIVEDNVVYNICRIGHEKLQDEYRAEKATENLQDFLLWTILGSISIIQKPNCQKGIFPIAISAADQQFTDVKLSFFKRFQKRQGFYNKDLFTH